MSESLKEDAHKLQYTLTDEKLSFLSIYTGNADIESLKLRVQAFYDDASSKVPWISFQDCWGGSLLWYWCQKIGFWMVWNQKISLHSM